MTVEGLPENKSLEYTKRAAIITFIFAILATVSSIAGFTSASTDLSYFSENLLLGNFIFIGFVITINERLAEVFVATFRRRTRATLQKKYDEETDENKKKERLQTVIDYKAETGRVILSFSLVIGCSLACLGMVRVFGPLLDSTAYTNKLHIVLIDVLDVLVTGWLIAGGSQGWNKFMGTISTVLDQQKAKSQSIPTP